MLTRIILILFVQFTWLFAQAPEVQAKVDPSQNHIGDQFTYTIEITTAKDQSVDLPGLVGNLANFEVKDLQSSESVQDNSVVHRWTLRLSTYVGGDYALPPQEVLVWKGADTLRTATQPVAIRVLGRLKDGDTDILDVDAPIQDPFTPWWVWALLIVLGILITGLVIWFLWKRWHRPVVIYVLPPYEEAIRNLQLLHERNLLAIGNQGEFFFALGQILRQYLHRRFDADVLDATLQELPERLLHKSEIQDSQRQGIVQFFQETEMVKFAKLTLSPEECSALTDLVRQTIEQTKPIVEAKK